MSTLVIHLDDRSTDFLKAIYDGLGYPVISDRISRQALLARIKAVDRVFMLGHGSPGGLFGAGYSIDDSFGPALAAKPDGLYIWCNADQYARRNRLSGLVSGMFISEVGEARMFGIEASQDEVDASNALFSATVRAVMDKGEPPEAVQQRYTHATCKVTQFNQKRMYIFKNGVSTPERYEEPPPVWSKKDDSEDVRDTFLKLGDVDTKSYKEIMARCQDMAAKLLFQKASWDELTDEEAQAAEDYAEELWWNEMDGLRANGPQQESQVIVERLIGA